MKRTIRQIIILLFAISSAISSIDCVLDDFLSFHEQITSKNECSEIPCNPNDAHLNHFDYIFYSDSGIQHSYNQNQLDLICVISIDLKSNYLSSIWQPPKQF